MVSAMASPKSTSWASENIFSAGEVGPKEGGKGQFCWAERGAIHSRANTQTLQHRLGISQESLTLV
jgi:hypothetical protein